MNSEPRARLGMIGCGGRMRALFRRDANIEVVALCDPHPESIRDTLAAYNPNAHVYDRYEDLVTDPAVDWVAVGSWNCLHKDHAVAALEAGKHVFCEKPLATTFEDCLAIRQAVQSSGRLFSFGLVLRYAPFYRKLADGLRSGVIGRLISFEFNETLDFNLGGYILGNWRRFRRNAGPYILEKCCHDMDLAIWLTGSLPVRAASFGGLDFYLPENRPLMDRVGRDAQGRQGYQTIAGVDLADPFTAEKDIVDNQVVILEYANGVRATFHTNCNAATPERRFYLLGTEGCLRGDSASGKLELQRIGFNTKPELLEIGPVTGGHAGGDAVLWKSICDSMLRGAPPLVSIDEALQSAITCFGIDLAMEQGTVVDLRPLWERAGIALEGEAPRSR